jgi:hypothetical protein
MADKNAVSLCSDDQVYVDVEQEADGGIVFVGQDLNPHNAYGGLEYEPRPFMWFKVDLEGSW